MGAGTFSRAKTITEPTFEPDIFKSTEAPAVHIGKLTVAQEGGAAIASTSQLAGLLKE